MSGSSTRRQSYGGACDPRLLRVLARIAKAVEQQTEALHLVHQSQLMLLDELTSEPEQGDKPEDDGTYLDGTPKH